MSQIPHWPDAELAEVTSSPCLAVSPDIVFKPPQLSGNAVQFWLADLDKPPVEQHKLINWLTRAEQERAARLRNDAVARRNAASRGLLRWMLGGYLGLAPERVQVTTAPNGKPFLAEQPDQGALHFNISHCENLALYAFTRCGPVGVDIELIRPVQDMSGIMTMCFSPQERSRISTLKGRDQREAFFRCWTLKEAVIKYTGKGFSTSLTRVTVEFWNETPNLVWDHENPEGRMILRSFILEDRAAVAVALSTQYVGDIEIRRLIQP